MPASGAHRKWGTGRGEEAAHGVLAAPLTGVLASTMSRAGAQTRLVGAGAAVQRSFSRAVKTDPATAAVRAFAATTGNCRSIAARRTTTVATDRKGALAGSYWRAIAGQPSTSIRGVTIRYPGSKVVDTRSMSEGTCSAWRRTTLKRGHPCSSRSRGPSSRMAHCSLPARCHSAGSAKRKSGPAPMVASGSTAGRVQRRPAISCSQVDVSFWKDAVLAVSVRRCRTRPRYSSVSRVRVKGFDGYG